MKTKLLFALPILISLVACSNQKPNKEQGGGGGGEQVPTNIYHGHGAPSDSLGEDYNHYYDEDSHYVYEKKSGKWINQLTLGSNSLYETKKPSKLLKRTEIEINTQELKNALMMSFYSTNVSCFMEQYFEIFPGAEGPIPGGPGTGSYVNVMIDGRNIKEPSVDYAHNPSYVPYENFYKVDDNGNVRIYEDGEYIEKNEYIKAVLPVPTFDNLSYYFLSVYDDELGEQTSIACGNMDKVSYDDSTGYYQIKNISIHHDPMYFFTTIKKLKTTWF